MHFIIASVFKHLGNNMEATQLLPTCFSKRCVFALPWGKV